MLSKIFIFICAIIGFLVLAIFGIGYFAVDRAMDNGASIFANQVISQVAQDWNKDSLNNYLDYEYTVGSTYNLSEGIIEIRKHKSNPADIKTLFTQAKNTLGDLKSIKDINCINFSNQISCFSGAEFAKGKAMLALGLRQTSAPSDKTVEYKINMFAIEQSK